MFLLAHGSGQALIAWAAKSHCVSRGASSTESCSRNRRTYSGLRRGSPWCCCSPRGGAVRLFLSPDGGADRGGGVPGALAPPSQLQMRAIVRGAARGGVWVRVFLAVLGASAGTVGAGLLVFYGTCRRTTR